MRKLGAVLHITPSNLVVVKCTNPKEIPPLGAHVMGADGEVIGRVVDIIGPISSPYIIVKPLSPSKLNAVHPSTVLYYRLVPKRKGRRSRRGRE
ncbi:MAG: hypothetical protein DRO12_00520 [Thermoprotei archaeon]|nr:MAG: hypothetical protein DRO12_00520 [Thermoprotei archaeon]